MKHLINDYYLDTDKNNYVLVKRGISTSGKNQGKEKFENIGYYGTNLELLYTRIFDLYIHENVLNIKFEEMLDTLRKIIKLRNGVSNNENV